MNQLISKLYLLNNFIDINTIKKTTHYTVQFKLKKYNEFFDYIVINNKPNYEDQVYFTIILMKMSSRTGCLIEGYKKPFGRAFGNGWSIMKSSIEEIRLWKL